MESGVSLIFLSMIGFFALVACIWVVVEEQKKVAQMSPKELAKYRKETG